MEYTNVNEAIALLEKEPRIEEYNELYCCEAFDELPQHILEMFNYIAENFGK
jgi:hypothetical protein